MKSEKSLGAIMQIITISDEEFSKLLNAWQQGVCVGRYWQDGKARTVCATSRFLLVAAEQGNNKFAVKSCRNESESYSLALQLLKREERRGNRVEFSNS